MGALPATGMGSFGSVLFLEDDDTEDTMWVCVMVESFLDLVVRKLRVLTLHIKYSM